MDQMPHTSREPIDPLRTRAVADTYGFELLGRRIDAIEPLLRDYLSQPLPKLVLEPGVVQVSGIGSSRAHAEYFTSLLNCSPAYNAIFQEIPYDGDSKPFSEGTTVLFSQGLSSNAHGIVQQQILAGNGLLFTAVTSHGLEQGGKADKAHLLRLIESSDVCTVPMPLEDEYETLIRVVGPWYGYLASYRVAAELLPEHYPAIDEAQLSRMFSRASESASGVLDSLSVEHLEKGIHLVSFGLGGALKNIGEKFVEGTFFNRPALSGILEFDHGPFQLIARRGGQVVLFRSQDESEREPAQRLRSGLERCGAAPLTEVYSQLPEPLRILEYEMVMNHVMLGLMKERGELCDQIRFVEGSNYDMSPGNAS